MSLNLPDRLEPYRSGVFQEITVRTFPHWRKSCFSSQISVITNILLVLLVCRHLMNKLDLESFSKLCWLGLWSRSGALKFLLRMQQTKNNCHDEISLLILFRLSQFCPVQQKGREVAKYLIDNRRQRYLSFSEAFRGIFQFNCIALRRSILISIEHARTFSISINGTAFPGLC